MPNTPTQPLDVVRTSASDAVHTGAWASRRVHQGKLIRIRRGSFMSAAAWNAHAPWDQHRIMAIETGRHLGTFRLISHQSAAVLLGLPTLHPPGARVHVTIPSRGGGIKSQTIAYHNTSTMPQLVATTRGVRCTTPARTILDLARSGDIESAVMAGDVALRESLTTIEELTATLDSEKSLRGYRRALFVISFLNALAESPTESLTRRRLQQVGAPTPRLQVNLSDQDGFIGRVDMLIPELNLVIEFDGVGKYGVGPNAPDVDTKRILLEEKRREDRIRALGYRVLRLQWRQIADLATFRALWERYSVAPLVHPTHI